MDTRTSQLLSALDPLSADLLINLLPSARSEKELLRTIEGTPQPTGHRKLRSLAKAGMVRQDPTAQGRGQPWFVSAPQETGRLLNALFDLADALENTDRQERQRSRAELASTFERPRLQLAE